MCVTCFQQAVIWINSQSTIKNWVRVNLAVRESKIQICAAARGKFCSLQVSRLVTGNSQIPVKRPLILSSVFFFVWGQNAQIELSTIAWHFAIFWDNAMTHFNSNKFVVVLVWEQAILVLSPWLLSWGLPLTRTTWVSCLLWLTHPSVLSRWRKPWQLVRSFFCLLQKSLLLLKQQTQIMLSYFV